MRINEIINGILELLEGDNEEFDGNLYSFSDNSKESNDKYKPTYTLTGYNTIKRYNELYQELFQSIVGKNKMTFKVFRDHTQQFIFNKTFNEEHLKEFVASKKQIETIDISKIYGLDIGVKIIEYDGYIFVNKTFIVDYLIQESKPKDTEFNNMYLEMLKNDSNSNHNFVYVVKKHQTIDNLYSVEVMKKELPEIVNAIRFMAGIKLERCYVDAVPFVRYSKSNFQSVGDWLTGGFELVIKDKPIMIDDAWFSDVSSGNDKIWKIFSEEPKNEMEQRLFNSINWVGKAFGENDERVALLEIAFAFESLLQVNTKEIISPSIMALLSEEYSFINGSTTEQRIDLEKEFKKFYSERSGLAHGGKSKITINPFYPFIMITNTIRNLLTSERFKDCKTIGELSAIIKEMKYTVS